MCLRPEPAFFQVNLEDFSKCLKKHVLTKEGSSSRGSSRRCVLCVCARIFPKVLICNTSADFICLVGCRNHHDHTRRSKYPERKVRGVFPGDRLRAVGEQEGGNVLRWYLRGGGQKEEVKSSVGR